MVMICNLVTVLSALALGVIVGRGFGGNIGESNPSGTRPVSEWPPRTFGNLEKNGAPTHSNLLR